MDGIGGNMPGREHATLAAELRALRVCTGGTGCFLLVVQQPQGGIRWITEKAYRTLDRIAQDMGYQTLPDAVWRGALPDVITEAIEAMEADPLVAIEVAC